MSIQTPVNCSNPSMQTLVANSRTVPGLNTSMLVTDRGPAAARSDSRPRRSVRMPTYQLVIMHSQTR